jgi:CBS domain-containing protein
MGYRSVGVLLRDQETFSLGPQATVQEAAVMMADHRVGAIPVIEEDGRLAGLFTERDLLNRVVAKGLIPSDLRLAEVMTANPITVSAEASLVTSLRLMFEHKFRHLPVVEGEHVIGVLSCRDIPADYWMMNQNWEAARNELRFATA